MLKLNSLDNKVFLVSAAADETVGTGANKISRNELIATGRLCTAEYFGKTIGGQKFESKLAAFKGDYKALSATGAIMGSGGMVVMDESTCMVSMAQFFLDFTAKESCGKCIHCRIGTKRMLEILNRIVKGEGKDGDIELLEELCLSIKDGALCGLGQTAPNPVLTTIKYFRNEYEAHINEKKCPAKSCADLLTYSINADKCKGCTLCAKKCPAGAISGQVKTAHVIDNSKCIKCGACLNNCRFGAVETE